MSELSDSYDSTPSSSCSSSSSSSSYSSPQSPLRKSRSVSIITPDRKRRRREFRESERKTERAIVSHLLKYRRCDSDDLEFEDLVEEELVSVDDPPSWPSFSYLEQCVGPDPKHMSYLEQCVGPDPKHMLRLTEWSQWTLPLVVPNESKNPVLWIRTIMKLLAQRFVFSDLKKIFFSNFFHFKFLSIPFGEYKRTILHAICLHPQIDLILPLLSQKVSFVAVDKFGLTPLHLAAMNVDCLKANSFFVLANQIGISHKKSGAFPIHFFLQRDRAMTDSQFEDAVKILMRNEKCFLEQRSVLHLVVSVRAAAIVLKVSKMDPNIRDANGLTPFHVACAAGLPEVAEFLLDRIPKQLLRCYESGSTALHLAAAGGSELHAECIRIISKRIGSAQILSTLKDKEGWPPLLYALFTNNVCPTVMACLALDLELRDPTWGDSPQLVYALHLARQENTRRSGSWTGETALEDKSTLSDLLRVLMSVPEIFTFLNKFIEKDISKLVGPLSFIIELDPKLLSLENKLKFFHFRAKAFTRRLSVSPSYSVLLLRPRKDRTRDWLLHVLHTLTPLQRGQALDARFLMPNGQDPEPGYGIGPTREFFTLVQETMNSVFQDGLPSNEIGMDMAHRAIGRVVGLSLLTGVMMDLSGISVILWKYLLGQNISTMENLEIIDPVLASSYKWMLNNELDDNITILLEGEGRNIFVQNRISKKLKRYNLIHFFDGFYDVIDKGWINEFFDSHELSVIFGSDGQSDINLFDWRENTRYIGDEDNRVEWFWDLIDQVPNKERQLLLMFVTGLAVPPLGGFAQLKSNGEPMLFTIMLLPETTDELLPTAATCFNMLRLPNYSGKAVMQQKLLTAIRFGSQGFLFV